MRAGAFVRAGGFVALGTFISYGVLLRHPQPLFAYSVQKRNLTLYCDREFDATAGKRVLGLAEQKLARSPLYSEQPMVVFICPSPWREVLLFNKDYGAGGLAEYPVTDHVFLRAARIEENRLLSRSGRAVSGDRTLDYFVTHELVHQLTGKALGPWDYLRLPKWVREGYADYVGKGDGFNYERERESFLAGAREMDWAKSGLYKRFHLLVYYLLDRQHWSVDRLLRHSPRQSEVEDQVRAEQ